MNIYVAIPANSNKQWEADYATFASFWWASTLQPGETHSRAGNDNGDLVFYLYPPADQNGGVPFGGVALVTNDDTCPVYLDRPV